MSSDNAIVILKTKDSLKKFVNIWCSAHSTGGIVAYRVGHVMAADDYDYLEKNELHNLGVWMNSCFKRGVVFYDEQLAMEEAIRLKKEIGYVEHGIFTIDATKYNFPNT